MSSTSNEDSRAKKELLEEIGTLRARLEEAEQILSAIRCGDVDALVVTGPNGDRVFSLSGAEREYRLIVETMNEAALTVGMDESILFCNQRFCALMECSMAEIIGRKITVFVAAAQRLPLQRLLADAQAGPLQRRLTLRTTKGSAVSVQIAASLLVNEVNTSICLVVSDLTELEFQARSIRVLREQQQALEESRAELQSANASLCDSRLQALSEAKDAIHARRQAEEANSKLLQEVAERKGVEEELRQSQERFRIMGEILPYGVWWCNAHGGAEYLSQSFLELLEISEDEMREFGWCNRLPPDEVEPMMKQWMHCVRTGEDWDSEHHILGPDGKYHTVLTRGRPVRDKKGSIVGWAGINLNIDDRKQAEDALKKFNEELETRVEERTAKLAQTVTALRSEMEARKQVEQQLLHAQKMECIGRLAGGVAHDFNNLLNGISGFGQIIQEGNPANDELQENVGQILSGAERAAELVRSLLAFSRKQIMNRKPVHIDSIIASAVKFICRVIGEDIEIRTDFSANTLPVMADFGQIEQVLMNLATNARDAMLQGGCLTITTREVAVKQGSEVLYDLPQPGKYARITFRDTGAGIDEEAMERIFEPFYTTKEVGKGTGLGLSIIYGIIKQHEGSIQVSSEPGKGTSFDIYLPLIDEQAVREETILSEPVAGGTETLLIAEDEEIVRFFLKKILEKAGYKVILAADGEEAMARFRERDDFSLVLSDVVMPKKNGKEILAEMREINPGIKMLFISGYTTDIIQKCGILDDHVAFITKPFSRNDLLQKIREGLDKE